LITPCDERRAGDKISLTAKPPSTPRLYAYQMPTEPGRGVSGVVRPRPIVAGQRLTTGAPDERHWEVVRVEPTERDGQRPLLSLGPPGFPTQDVIWAGRLILRPRRVTFLNPGPSERGTCDRSRAVEGP
jgi:hypothetical protein